MSQAGVSPEAGSSKAPPIREDAPFVNEAQYMCNFQTCLKENLEDIRVYEYEPTDEDCVAVWSPLICRNCGNNFETRPRLLDHMLQCEFTADDAVAYFEHNLISKDIQKVLDEAQNERAKDSFLVKTIADDEDIKLILPMTSPLATYMFRGMTIYSKKWPKNNQKVIPANVTIDNEPRFLYFTARDIAQKYDDFALRRRTEEMSKNIKVIHVAHIPDIVLDASMRSDEDTRELVKALKFEENMEVSQEDIIREVEKRFGVKIPDSTDLPPPPPPPAANENNTMETEVVVEENQKTPKKDLQDKGKLRSDFTPNYLDPKSPKRKSITPKKTDL